MDRPVTGRFARSAAVAVLLAAAASGQARAQSLSSCVFPTMTSLARLYAGDASSVSFARMNGGTISVGAAVRYRVSITGCPSVSYRFWFTAPVRVTSGGKSVEVYPVVTAVNGVQRPPQSLVGSDNAVALSGNPSLEMVFAVDPSVLPLTAGSWSGVSQVIFEN